MPTEAAPKRRLPPRAMSRLSKISMASRTRSFWSLPVSMCSERAPDTPTARGAEILRHGISEWWGSAKKDRRRGSDGGQGAAELLGALAAEGGEAPAEETSPEAAKASEAMLQEETVIEVQAPVAGWWGKAPSEEEGLATRPCQRGLFGPLRRAVAGGRTRYVWNGFDLDLTYVTSRLVAMSLPARGFVAAYRNPRGEVLRFLRRAHGDNFRIYNLCAEPKNSSNGILCHTVRYPFFDHCPPALPMMLAFCRDVEAWLSADEANVAVIHCKAGKGRCGTMLCALLVYARAFPSAYEALRWFAHVRGGKHSGVTIPSQIRWIAMFERCLRCGADGLSSHPLGGDWRGGGGVAAVAPAAGTAGSLNGGGGSGEGGGDAGAVPRLGPYRLRCVRLGPVRPELLRSGGNKGPQALVRVGLAAREAIYKKLKDSEPWYWYEEVLASLGKGGLLEVVLPAGGPVLAGSDGVLAVQVRRPGGRKTPAMHVRAWWCHAFLQQRLRTSGLDLVLDLPKAYVDGMQGDMAEHKAAPAEFRFSAALQDLRGASTVATSAEAKDPVLVQKDGLRSRGASGLEPRVATAARLAGEGQSRWPPLFFASGSIPTPQVHDAASFRDGELATLAPASRASDRIIFGECGFHFCSGGAETNAEEFGVA